MFLVQIWKLKQYTLLIECYLLKITCIRILCLSKKKRKRKKEKKNPRILWVSAYALAIITVYTAWAAFGEMSRSALEIKFDFFLLLANQNIYANEVLNMCIWWRQTTWLVLLTNNTHIPSFINVAHTELWIYDIFVISQSKQICKWGIRQTTWVVLVPPLPTHQVLWKLVIVFSLEKQKFTFAVDEILHTSTHPSVHTYRQHYKWKLSGPSSIAGSPQKEILRVTLFVIAMENCKKNDIYLFNLYQICHYLWNITTSIIFN